MLAVHTAMASHEASLQQGERGMVDEAPVLFQTGPRKLFPLVRGR